MKLEVARPSGVASPFLKTMVPVWPVGMKDESAETDNQGVSGWPVEPVIDETIE